MEDDFETARVLFDEVIRIEPSRRDAFLADRCAGNEELAANLRKLLDAHESTGAFLDQTAAGLLTGMHAVAEWVRSAPAPELRPDQAFGRYRILRRLGVGGMGEVYLAEDPALGRRVAIKLLPPSLEADETRKRRLEREARLTSLLNHSGIMTVYDIGQAEGRMFIAAEFVDGVTLRQQLSNGPLPPIEALRIAGRVADALEAAHAAHVIHRDIKPENVMVRQDGAVKVLDFGAATAAPSGAPGERTSLDAGTPPFSLAASQAFGTICYASPEQVQGMELDARTDVWSLGALLYELVSGNSPFAAPESAETIHKILNEDPPPLPAPANRTELRRILGRALAKPIDERYPSMRDFREDIERARHRLTRRPRTAIAAWLVAGALFAGLFLWWLLRPAAIQSVAVLPFKPLVVDGANPYLQVGIADALIARLGRLHRVVLRPLGSVRKYGRAEQDPLAAGRELGVDSVLDGAIQQSGGKIRVRAQLFDVRSGQTEWSGEFDSQADDPLEIQDAMASQISRALALRLSRREEGVLARHDTENREAYLAFLQGRYHAGLSNRAGFAAAMTQFRKAIDLDPSYAQAYVGLADALYNYGQYDAPNQYIPQAETAVRRALELDEATVGGHALLGSILYRFRYDWQGAEREFRREMQLNPNDASVHSKYGWFLSMRGRIDEATREMNQAFLLAPNAASETDAVLPLYAGGQFVKAEAPLRRIIEANPKYVTPYFALSLVLMAQHRWREAIDTIRRGTPLDDDLDFLTSMGVSYARLGERTEAERCLDRLRDLATRRYVSPASLGLIYLALGDRDRAMEYLQLGYEDHSWWMIFLKVDPRFDDLRGDARFRDLVKKVGLD